MRVLTTPQGQRNRPPSRPATFGAGPGGVVVDVVVGGVVVTGVVVGGTVEAGGPPPAPGAGPVPWVGTIGPPGMGSTLSTAGRPEMRSTIRPGELTRVPPSGSCSTTVPSGWSLRTGLGVTVKPSESRYLRASTSCWPTTRGTSIPW